VIVVGRMNIMEMIKNEVNRHPTKYNTKLYLLLQENILDKRYVIKGTSKMRANILELNIEECKKRLELMGYRHFFAPICEACGRKRKCVECSFEFPFKIAILLLGKRRYDIPQLKEKINEYIEKYRVIAWDCLILKKKIN